MEERSIKFYAKGSNKVAVHAIPGHFATCNSHINYYVDVTSLKTRVNEAKSVAELLVQRYHPTMCVDTIVCLDGTEVIGAFLAEEFENRNFLTNNMHETIYVVTPEYNSSNQLMFRDNIAPSIRKKHVVLLLGTTTTGASVQRAVECVRYYGGIVEAVASVFSTISEVNDMPVESVFDGDDVPNYSSYTRLDCPFCKKGIPVEAMVNGFGYSKL
ncbi:MAG: orotate phosphoribosyltransferase [Lachnospiraceae bacterium]